MIHGMKTNIKLTHAECYKDTDEIWYMKLVYEYEDTDGIHELIIPKVELPVYSHMIPDIRTEWALLDCVLPIEERLTGIKEDIRVYRANVPECNVNNVTWVDRIIKPAVHEMTIDEIEKKLGYKVKIVNGSNKK